MKIENFSFDTETSTARWMSTSGAVEVRDLKQAAYDYQHDVVIALPKRGAMDQLLILDELGTVVVEIPPPDGYLIEYLLPSGSSEIRIVCSIKTPSGDTIDWYFSFNPVTGEFTRRGRAY